MRSLSLSSAHFRRAWRLIYTDICFREKLPKFEKPLSLSFFKGIIHNLELLSFQKMCGLYGFLFKTQALDGDPR